MLIHPTINQLQELKLSGMVEALSEQLQDSAATALSFEERLGLLIERETVARCNKLLRSRLKQAKLHFARTYKEHCNRDGSPGCGNPH